MAKQRIPDSEKYERYYPKKHKHHRHHHRHHRHHDDWEPCVSEDAEIKYVVSTPDGEIVRLELKDGTIVLIANLTASVNEIAHAMARDAEGIEKFNLHKRMIQ